MFEMFKKLKRQRQTEHELSSLSDRELWDIGISRSTIPTIVKQVV